MCSYAALAGSGSYAAPFAARPPSRAQQHPNSNFGRAWGPGGSSLGRVASQRICMLLARASVSAAPIRQGHTVRAFSSLKAFSWEDPERAPGQKRGRATGIDAHAATSVAHTNFQKIVGMIHTLKRDLGTRPGSSHKQGETCVTTHLPAAAAAERELVRPCKGNDRHCRHAPSLAPHANQSGTQSLV